MPWGQNAVCLNGLIADNIVVSATYAPLPPHHEHAPKRYFVFSHGATAHGTNRLFTDQIQNTQSSKPLSYLAPRFAKYSE